MNPRQRISMRISEAARATGASRSEIRARVASGEIRAKRVGRAIYLDPASVEAVFGFQEAEPKPLDPKSLALVRELLS